MQVSMKRWSWVAAVAGLAMYSSNAKALVYTEMYEMNASPTTVGGTTFGNVLYIADPAGTGTKGPEGFTYSGGIGTFLDDASSSGNQGVAVGNNTQAAWLQGSSNYIADFKIQILANQTGNGGQKSLSFWSGNGRGLQLNTGSSTFVSSGPTGSVGSHNFAVYDTYRVIVNNPANTVDLYYSLDGDVNNGNGDNVLLSSATMGGSGFWGGSTVGFALGSTGGSSTTLSNFNLDWFRIYSGATGVDNAFTPEPASLALLALGAVPMMIRRRRAA